MSGLRYCSVCRHDVRDYGRHLTSAEHSRKSHPIGSRRGARANAKRAKRRAAEHTLTKSWERRMWDEAEKLYRAEVREAARLTGRHFYGAWTRWGQPAYAGGHPGRGRRRR
jgi:hypothetical protein